MNRNWYSKNFANTNRILLKLSIYHSLIIWSRRPESFDSRSFPNERCVDHNTEEWFVRDQSELPRPISINSANVPAFLPALEQKIFTAIAAEKQMTQVDRHYKGKRLDNNTRRKPSPLYNGAWIEWCSFTLWQTIFSMAKNHQRYYQVTNNEAVHLLIHDNNGSKQWSRRSELRYFISSEW